MTTPRLSRPRHHSSATVPDRGSLRAYADVLVTWDVGTPLADIEEAIKEAAREAVHRVREDHP